jgi:hypothetical protein
VASNQTEVERARGHVWVARLAAETLQSDHFMEPNEFVAIVIAELLQAEVLLSRRIQRSKAQQTARDLLRRAGRDDDGIPSQW